MTEPPSKREKKRQVSQGLDRLKRQAGWDPAVSKHAAQERLQAAQQTDRAKGVYHQADDCAECATSRRESGDETALCDAHLAAAMGV